MPENPGWLCPACGRGNAPWVAQCPCVQPKQWRVPYPTYLCTLHLQPVPCPVCSSGVRTY